ncbi:MAG TPA: hypothetical protein VHZ78_11275 [Rhizomicrobium sp.]|jgi:hypothetical protein|nr:hypothetical protein [Rhizomicrobium sp.]
MAKYFFNIRDRHGVVTDDEGSELETLSGALLEADASARDVAKQLIDGRRSLSETFVDVANDDGTVVATVSVMEMLSEPLSLARDATPRVSDEQLRTALVGADAEHALRKQTISDERTVLDERDSAEDVRWLDERSQLIARWR